eukprot:TRINITY_DN4148_c0_g1_i1.p1 TRINITY_DN4148_c0_g1~~TRINITY_DN4148_c0_g1_i1.p1  ORF type:complete len:156 (-),score=38.44 TRINITY_DN4148_c0_g1_i1:10-477(-)
MEKQAKMYQNQKSELSDKVSELEKRLQTAEDSTKIANEETREIEETCQTLKTQMKEWKEKVETLLSAKNGAVKHITNMQWNVLPSEEESRMLKNIHKKTEEQITQPKQKVDPYLQQASPENEMVSGFENQCGEVGGSKRKKYRLRLCVDATALRS